MRAETQSRVYNPFFTTKGSLGMGLELWVMAKTLARHQRGMHVRRSAEPGGKSNPVGPLVTARIGTKFEFTDRRGISTPLWAESTQTMNTC